MSEMKTHRGEKDLKFTEQPEEASSIQIKSENMKMEGDRGLRPEQRLRAVSARPRVL